MISNITTSSGTDGATAIILTFEHPAIPATMGLGKPCVSHGGQWGVGGIKVKYNCTIIRELLSFTSELGCLGASRVFVAPESSAGLDILT